MRKAIIMLVSLVLLSAASEGSNRSSSMIWFTASYQGRPFYEMTIFPHGRVEVEVNDVDGEYSSYLRDFVGSVDPILVDLLRALLERCPRIGESVPLTRQRLRLVASTSDGTSDYSVSLSHELTDYKNLARGLIVLINNLITDYDLDSQNYLDVGLVDQLSRVYAQEARWLRVGLGILTLLVILQSIALVGIIWKQKR